MIGKLLAAGMVVLLSTAAAKSEDSLVLVSFSGDDKTAGVNAFDEPFEKETGIKIVREDKALVALAGVRAQQESNSISWNIVTMLQSNAQRACDEGLVLEINLDEWASPASDGTLPSKDFMESTQGKCFIPVTLFDTVLAYNSSAFGDSKPQSVADVWNLEKFPGKRALQNIPQRNLEWALMADGVPLDQVYTVLATPEGQDRAFASLDKIKSQVIWWSAAAQALQLLADKEVSVAASFNGRVFASKIKENQPFEIIWNGAVFDVSGWVIPANQSEETLAKIKSYVRSSTETSRMANLTAYIPYGPARKSSLEHVGKFDNTDIDMLPHLPTSPDNMALSLHFNADFWANYGEVLEERFNAWMVKN